MNTDQNYRTPLAIANELCVAQRRVTSAISRLKLKPAFLLNHIPYFSDADFKAVYRDLVTEWRRRLRRRGD
ncbi:MAG TPA: hypothetical protein VD994_03290 [Prosthecobacter sp.]|nr:hypothetical protein [Prosthecobacter sp.]